MKDAFERRALLLHLGDALQTLSTALAADAKHHTVHHLLNAHAELAGHAWLAAVSPKMKASEFAKRASASFAEWPALLLEEQVDYTRLALAVHDHLFADDRTGWRTYVDAMKREVEWFGDALPFAEEPVQAAEAAPSPDETDTRANDADVERADEGSDPQRDSVESNGGLYPAWPWKPVV
ncbi:hypothetical protein [Paraburkholderia terrae]|uniref:Uncharacterized protein n=1 Tax=Paraburkholderia terrae TaxID=311230 RepID=A0A2I8EIU2_9BURK|nr:hypothetical protein [Paraburkholderia terrae]AUT59379.1 hypothetical protein C2L65_07025 [Paraburkholderia terrae]